MALLIWGGIVIVPKIREQSVSFVNHFPQYIDTIDQKSQEILSDPLFAHLENNLKRRDKVVSSLGTIIKTSQRSQYKELVISLGRWLRSLSPSLRCPLFYFIY